MGSQKMAHARNTFKGCQICLGAIYLFPSCLKHDGVKSASSFSSILLDPSNCHSSCRSSGQTWLWNWSQGLKDLHISRSSPALLASLPVPEWTSSNFPVWRFIIEKSFFGSSQVGCFVQSLSWGRRGGVRFRRRLERCPPHNARYPSISRRHTSGSSGSTWPQPQTRNSSWLMLSRVAALPVGSEQRSSQAELSHHGKELSHACHSPGECISVVHNCTMCCSALFGSISFHSYYMQTETPGLHVPLAALLFFHFKALIAFRSYFKILQVGISTLWKDVFHFTVAGIMFCYSSIRKFLEPTFWYLLVFSKNQTKYRV